jgi:ribosomal protein S27AE
MVFYIPMVHECPKCGHKIEFSRSATGLAGAVSSEGEPFCPKCFDAFLKEHVPVMTNLRIKGEQYGY